MTSVYTAMVQKFIEIASFGQKLAYWCFRGTKK
jgi:hypothetical protein